MESERLPCPPARGSLLCVGRGMLQLYCAVLCAARYCCCFIVVVAAADVAVDAAAVVVVVVVVVFLAFRAVLYCTGTSNPLTATGGSLF